MIHRLRGRFIRIATLSVAVVMLFLTIIVNGANFISVNNDLTKTLDLISRNQGTIPTQSQSAAPAGEDPPQGDPPGGRPEGPFTQETPFSTRYFVLRYDDDGTLEEAELAHIAAVTQEDTGPYLAAAVQKGTGSGFYGHYKFLVLHTGADRNMAIFLDGYQQLRQLKLVALWSVLADGVCIALVYVLVVLLSRRAIDPVVRSAARQKQFITDASHELKTPLTVMITSLKVLEMEVGQQKWIDKARAQADKMGALVNSLVTLSRLDEEAPPVTMAPFGLSDAVTDVAESFRQRLEEGGHPLTLAVEPDISYTGDEGALRQLVSILLDNAARYASPGGGVTLRLARGKRRVTLTSANPCPPLDKEALSKLFDRFYRPDSSRTAATGGFGVGLSIARSIVEVHGGTITADYTPAGEIVFTAVFKEGK